MSSRFIPSRLASAPFQTVSEVIIVDVEKDFARSLSASQKESAK
jgi:hypothetical protein